MATLVVHYEMSDLDFEDAYDAAGYGIGYWALEAECAIQPDSTLTYTVRTAYPEDFPLDVVLTRWDFSEAICALATSTTLRAADALRTVVLTGDLADFDAECGDVVVQQAAFGEIVYG